MPEWVYGLIGVVAATAIIVYIVTKKRNDEWEGELIKKRHNPGDMDMQETFNLVFKTEGGKKKRFQVNKKMFDEWNEGDKAKKEKGQFHPTKES